MGPSRQGGCKAARGRRGLVLVELALFLAVIVLGVGLASLLIGRSRHHARLERLGADLQAFAIAFVTARTEGGKWPQTAEDAGARLMDAGWDDGPPVGGEYGWVPPAGGRPGLITVTAFAPNFPLDLTPSDLLVIDRAIDDGDLATGRFHAGFNGWPVYEVPDQR